MKRGILTIAILVGGAAGAIFAAGTVPDPSCADGDSMCTLQKLYLAQTMKVVGGMALGYVLAAALVVKAPEAVQEHQAVKRRQQYKERMRAEQAAGRVVVDASAARAAFEQAQRPAALPAAALSAIARHRDAGPPPGVAAAQQRQLAALEAAMAAGGAGSRRGAPGPAPPPAAPDPYGPPPRAGLATPAALGGSTLAAPVGLPPAALRAARAQRPVPAPRPAAPRRAPGGLAQGPVGLPPAALRANQAARVGGLRARPPAPPSRSGQRVPSHGSPGADDAPRGLRARPAPPPPARS